MRCFLPISSSNLPPNCELYPVADFPIYLPISKNMMCTHAWITLWWDTSNIFLLELMTALPTGRALFCVAPPFMLCSTFIKSKSEKKLQHHLPSGGNFSSKWARELLSYEMRHYWLDRQSPESSQPLPLPCHAKRLCTCVCTWRREVMMKLQRQFVSLTLSG